LETNTSFNQIKDTVESHCRKLEQVEDRIAGLKENIDNIKEGIEEYLKKTLKSCERHT
jgi:uncharacterized protein Yka (UPF0111/DUF47 family)